MNSPAARSIPKNTRIGSISARDARKGDNLDLATRQRDTAQYLSDLILELRNLAKSAKLFQVMVPLEYAYYEAFGAANRVTLPEGEAERLRQLSRAAEGDMTPEDY